MLCVVYYKCVVDELVDDAGVYCTVLQNLRTVCEVGPSQWCGSVVLRTEPCRPASEICTSPHSLIVLEMIICMYELYQYTEVSFLEPHLTEFIYWCAKLHF
jgi:hypothetical protein